MRIPDADKARLEGTINVNSENRDVTVLQGSRMADANAVMK